jgi:chorismate-pyruvate lyase
VGLSLPVTASEPSGLQRLLLYTPGTVTHLLETLTGELIFADVIRQYSIPASAADGLEVTVGHPITRRMAVLRGRASDLPYLYAESTYLPERLPERAQAQLARTDDPIGRVLVTHGLRTGREVLPPPGPVESDALSIIAGHSSEFVWSRAYRLIIDGLPVFAIREWFLQSVLEALDRQAPS